MHIILKELSKIEINEENEKEKKLHKIDIIAQNSEKYIQLIY